MPDSATLLKMLLVLAATLAVLGAVRVVQVKLRPRPEIVRKLLHIGSGLVALMLPWLFDRLWPVLVIGAVLAALFAAMRLVPALREGPGQVLHGVERSTIGEFCFLAAVALLFWLSHGNKLLYSVSILLVALADALAALIGTEYGKVRLHMRGERKSIEGAAVFFLTAFLCIHVPVLLWGGTGRLESLLIAVAVGSMVMLAEAAAWWGIDNLIIPLWGYMTLKSLLAMDAAQLWSQLGFLASLGAFTWIWRRRTSLGDDALAGTVLWGYVVWAVGGFVWVLAPLLQLATYATITVRSPLDRLRGLSFPVVLANIAGAMFWLLIYRQEGNPALFLPFAVCYGVNVAIIALVRAKYAFPALARLRVLSLATSSGMLIVLPSLLVAYGLSLETLAGIVAALVVIAGATEVFIRIQPGIEDLPIDAGRWLRQASLAAVASAAALGLSGAQLWALQRLLDT